MMTRSATRILDHDFLAVRHRILDIAAALDRLERGAGSAELDGDPRMGRIRETLAILGDRESGRAARIQMAFSRSYDPDWRQ